MNDKEIKDFKEYFTPRTNQEQTVLDLQVKQKVNTLSFFALSAGAFGLAPVLGVGILSVSAFGAGVYCTCKVLENYKLATENLKLFHAMKKETSIKSKNYKDLTEISEVINDKDSSLGNIIDHIKKLRIVEHMQKQKYTPK